MYSGNRMFIFDTLESMHHRENVIEILVKEILSQQHHVKELYTESGKFLSKNKIWRCYILTEVKLDYIGITKETSASESLHWLAA